MIEHTILAHWLGFPPLINYHIKFVRVVTGWLALLVFQWFIPLSGGDFPLNSQP